jgi:hypothetical protein
LCIQAKDRTVVPGGVNSVEVTSRVFVDPAASWARKDDALNIDVKGGGAATPATRCCFEIGYCGRCDALIG